MSALLPCSCNMICLAWREHREHTALCLTLIIIHWQSHICAAGWATHLNKGTSSTFVVCCDNILAGRRNYFCFVSWWRLLSCQTNNKHTTIKNVFEKAKQTDKQTWETATSFQASPLSRPSPPVSTVIARAQERSDCVWSTLPPWCRLAPSAHPVCQMSAWQTSLTTVNELTWQLISDEERCLALSTLFTIRLTLMRHICLRKSIKMWCISFGEQKAQCRSGVIASHMHRFTSGLN